ncbi:hypothetical protein I553_0183 [Mycobacterium xenopi 4042]|uniref:Uncharacterized protein n=1 Tax=Mycobacterium xenopi 4042 TaxID=1299334 RepID=X7YK99_MYCXE|nr:hypothetical protein I553_0183 [Mycobacterium xenopi 4042]EUA19517.1 hypothetical protein I552_9260 [Mycobacterium xenopi 3993]
MAGRQLAWTAKQAVDHVAHRAVTTVHDHHVDSGFGGGLRDLAAMTAVSGVLDGQLKTAPQRVRQQVAPSRVVEVAVGLTISTARMGSQPTGWLR